MNKDISGVIKAYHILMLLYFEMFSFRVALFSPQTLPVMIDIYSRL